MKTRQEDVHGFLKYRDKNPEWKPTPEQEEAISNIANQRVANAAGSPYREPEGWGDWASRLVSETPGAVTGAVSNLFSTKMTPEEQVKDFGKTLPGMGANMVEGTAGSAGDMGGLKSEIVNAINQYFNSPDNFVGASSNMDMSLDLARARKFDQSNLPTSEGIRENVTRPLVGSSVDYEPQGPAGKIGSIASNLVGPEDLIPAGAASKVIRLLRKVPR